MSELSRRSIIGIAGLGVAGSFVGKSGQGQTGSQSSAVPALPGMGANIRVQGVEEPGGRSDVLHAKDFGAVGDGITDDTAALQALFGAMQSQHKPGVLGGGAESRYVVRGGEWVWTFNNNPVSAAPGPPGPTLMTAGKVVIVAKMGSRDAPLLSVHNDPASGGRFIHGGFIGGMWFEDKEPGLRNRHGLNLYGVEFLRAGPMFSSALNGDLIHIESKGDAYTADAWHVSGCIFEGAGTWNTFGWTFNNDSVSQTFNFNQILNLWNIAGDKGIFRGPGANNSIGGVSCYQCRGWALDLVPDVGTTQGFHLGGADLDAPEFGVRIDGLQFADLRNIRVTHRVGEDRIPPSSSWPREGVRLGGRTAGTVTTDLNLTILHRLGLSITPSTQGNLGSFVTFSNDPSVARINLEQHVNPSVRGVSLSSQAFKREIHPSSSGNLLFLDGRPIHDTRIKNIVRATASGGRVASTGYLTKASKLAFDSVNIDDGGNFDRGSREYVVPFTGYFRVRAQIRLSTRGGGVQLAIMVTRGDTISVIAEAISALAAVSTSHSIETLEQFMEGDRIWISAQQSSAAQFLPIEAGAGSAANNRLEVVPI